MKVENIQEQFIRELLIEAMLEDSQSKFRQVEHCLDMSGYPLSYLAEVNNLALSASNT